MYIKGSYYPVKSQSIFSVYTDLFYIHDMANNNNNNRPDIDFETDLWKAADELRGAVAENMYKDFVLSLIFIKHLKIPVKLNIVFRANCTPPWYRINKYS